MTKAVDNASTLVSALVKINENHYSGNEETAMTVDLLTSSGKHVIVQMKRRGGFSGKVVREILDLCDFLGASLNFNWTGEINATFVSAV